MEMRFPYPKPGDPIKADDIGYLSRRLEPLVNPERGDGIASSYIGGVKQTRGLQSSTYNVPVLNKYAGDIPPYGIVKIVPDASQQGGVLSGNRPDTFGSQWMHMINCPETCENGDVKMMTNQFPAIVAYDPADGTPAVGEFWGPRSGGFLARKNTGGFAVVGSIDEDEETMQVVRAPLLSLWCKPTGAIALNASGLATVFYGPGTGTSTGQTITLYVAKIAGVGAGNWVLANWMDNQRWEAINSVCS